MFHTYGLSDTLQVLSFVKISFRTGNTDILYLSGFHKEKGTRVAKRLLASEILATEPQALVAIGPGAVRDIDAIEYPLIRHPFSDADPGVWFAWTKGTIGLVLPAIAPALNDDATKRRFWQAFLSLKALSP